MYNQTGQVAAPARKPAVFPEMFHVRQHFPRPRVDDVEAAVLEELEGCQVPIPAGTSVAIAVGSRGIANLARVVRAVVGWVIAQGAQPFIVPAMGSHGGATAEGQRMVLEGYGITEESTGAPVRSSMEVVSLPQGTVPVPLYFDRQASQAYGTILINRVKPHTDFHGPYESGLMKMIVIGLGKQVQALAIHDRGVVGLREIIPQAARQVLQQGRILIGVALVENAYDETQLVRAIPAAEIPEREPELLALARRSMPRLPLEELDVLVIDWFGKDISGAGLDPNIIGRLMIRGQPEPPSPRIGSIVLGDLTPGSHGNAVGLGLADIMLRRAYDQIDWSATYQNLFTSSFLERGRTPVVVNTDQEAMLYALRGAGVIQPQDGRVIRIRDTLHLSELYVSRPVVEGIHSQGNIEVIRSLGEPFDSSGRYQQLFQ